MRIFILGMDEPLFIPRLFGSFVEARSKEIVGIGLTSIFPRRRRARALLRHIRLVGALGFGRDLLMVLTARLLDAWSRIMLWGTGRRPRRYFSLGTLGRAYGIPVRRVRDVNAEQFANWLLGRELDLIICQVPDILKPPVLTASRLGCLNKHASLLPRYRGLHPVFWALLEGEREVGVTFYLMRDEIDRGPIILQHRLEITPNETLYEVYRRVFDIAGLMLPEAVRRVESGSRFAETRLDTGTYYSHPTRADARRFRKMGRRFGVPSLG